MEDDLDFDFDFDFDFDLDLDFDDSLNLRIQDFDLNDRPKKPMFALLFGEKEMMLDALMLISEQFSEISIEKSG